MGSDAASPGVLDKVTPLLDLRSARPSDGADRTRLGLVSGRSGPRFLVPVGHPAAASASCLAYLGLRPVRTRVTRGAVGLALRAGLGRLVAGEVLTADVGPESLLAHLADVLGGDLAVGVGLGSMDEVWKPTLQVFSPGGEPLAFVKIGLGPVADHLVATECEALRTWGSAQDPRLVVPELLADTTWRGIRLAVVAPLPADARRLPPGTPSAWPVRTLEGAEQVATLETAPWWQHRVAATDTGPETETGRRVASLLERVAARHGTDDHRWARWHGDWVPWNLARCRRGLIAWDWEYSEPAAPVGLDEVHAAYQVAHVVRGRSIHDALASARAVAPSRWLADAHVVMLVTRSQELVARAGTAPAHQAELLAAADAVLS